MKLVNVKLDDALGRRVETIAKVNRTTITEVVRTAVQKDVDDIWRDVNFQASAKAMLEAELAGLGKTD